MTAACTSLVLVLVLVLVPHIAAFLSAPNPRPLLLHHSFLSSHQQPRWVSAINAANTPTDTRTHVPDAEMEAQVMQQLSSIVDPDLHQDIVTLGFIKDLAISTAQGHVSFVLELTTPACPVKDDLLSQCRQNVAQLPWVKSVDVVLSASQKSSYQTPSGLTRVKNIIAVSSCKGGVGKSTTAVNLAYSLQQSGASVGILDADIYGPSLPTMVKPDKIQIEFIQNQIKPLEYAGVKLMSFGYLNPGAAIMRGPMVTQLLNQFVSLTSWGDLDYLVIDMPPGTGDIALTLCQIVNITAAVIVTTPQRISFVDVVKGIDMFDTMNVPCVAVVENMATYSTIDEDILVQKIKASAMEALSSKEVTNISNMLDHVLKAAVEASKVQRPIFGPGHANKLRDMWGIETLVRVPVLEEVSASGDSGIPHVITHKNTPAWACFNDLASRVVRETAKVVFQAKIAPSVHYDVANNIMSYNGSHVAPSTLRRACKCAVCVEELTGRPLLDPASVSDSVKPMGMAPIGKYAVSVDWSDGHKSLYPFKSIQALCETQGHQARMTDETQTATVQ